MERNSENPVFTPYIIKHINGIKVCFIGLIGKANKSIQQSGVYTKEPVESARNLLSALRDRYHLAIALTDLTFEENMDLASIVD
jgi:2',3'-cyclic-nucleotide 2'-phosphodiesterase (5'-nucleotidase family)